MLNMLDVILDPDFVQSFILLRTTGQFGTTSDQNQGVWQATEGPPQTFQGTILPARPSELEALPEGERHDGAIAIWCTEALQIGDQQITSPDTIFWNGNYYRVAWIKFYAQANLYKAIATIYHRIVPPGVNYGIGFGSQGFGEDEYGDDN
jgi:hypothetical protein